MIVLKPTNKPHTTTTMKKSNTPAAAATTTAAAKVTRPASRAKKAAPAAALQNPDTKELDALTKTMEQEINAQGEAAILNALAIVAEREIAAIGDAAIAAALKPAPARISKRTPIKDANTVRPALNGLLKIKSIAKSPVKIKNGTFAVKYVAAGEPARNLFTVNEIYTEGGVLYLSLNLNSLKAAATKLPKWAGKRKASALPYVKLTKLTVEKAAEVLALNF